MKNMIRWRDRALMLAGSGVLALCLSGCIIAVTERQLYWNGLYTEQAVSPCWAKGPTSFSKINYIPEPGTPVITIRMPDGKFIPANDLNRDTLASYFAAGTATEDKIGVRIRYDRGHVDLWLDEHGKPKRVEVEVDRGYTQGKAQENSPALSTPNGNIILEFPLHDKDLEALFGEPTKDERKTEYGPLTV